MSEERPLQMTENKVHRKSIWPKRNEVSHLGY